jgi:hypothetical protein
LVHRVFEQIWLSLIIRRLIPRMVEYDITQHV